MSSIGNESWRFWMPVGLLLILMGYSAQTLICSHLNDDIASLDYSFENDLAAQRGSIYDVNGIPLVKSILTWDYHLDPVALTNRIVRRKGEPRRPPEAIVKTIATALKLNYSDVLKMSKDSAKRYQPLAISDNADVHRTLADSHLVSGVSIEDRQERQYLHRRQLSHVLGAVNSAHLGCAGIEQKFESQLRGIAGKVKGLKDARGNELYDKRIISIDPINGDDIYLTIDHNLQYEAETALMDGIKEFGAGSGWCIIMNARTGAIMAMASLPDFDPDKYSATNDRAKRNRAIAFNYEPGSVMKVITACAAVDSGRYQLENLYSTDIHEEGYYKLPKDEGHVWEPKMSIADAIVHSSNIVIGKLGYDLGSELLYDYMRRFGFGMKTGIELPGEETGILFDPKKRAWDKATCSRAPIGQAFSVTAIQLISAYQAIANNGIRMRPYIVEKTVSPFGTVKVHEPEILGQPITPATARKIREVMTKVATPEGTARRAAIRGYSVAGKTGTAQKSAGRAGYVKGLYRATFCGMAPALDPEIVTLVTLDFDTKAKYHQGGNSAAPIFRRIMTAALRYLRVEPDKPDELIEFMGDDEFDKIMDARATKYGIIHQD